jgi:hypothetical protein
MRYPVLFGVVAILIAIGSTSAFAGQKYGRDSVYATGGGGGSKVNTNWTPKPGRQ